MEAVDGPAHTGLSSFRLLGVKLLETSSIPLVVEKTLLCSI